MWIDLMMLNLSTAASNNKKQRAYINAKIHEISKWDIGKSRLGERYKWKMICQIVKKALTLSLYLSVVAGCDFLCAFSFAPHHPLYILLCIIIMLRSHKNWVIDIYISMQRAYSNHNQLWFGCAVNYVWQMPISIQIEKSFSDIPHLI